jgi:uncharacterized protein YndB with AHSA1/START domain
MSRLEFQLKLKIPIKLVWSAWIESEIIVKWFSPEAFIEPYKGGAYELYFDPLNHEHMSTKGCKITEITPFSHLSFQWRGPDQFIHIMNNPDPITHVHIEFNEKLEGTMITVVHEGWGIGEDWNKAKEWHYNAWKGVLHNLENYFFKYYSYNTLV